MSTSIDARRRWPTRFATLQIVAKGGSIFAPDRMQLWFSARQSLIIFEREWPGVWPPEVGDTFQVPIPEGDGDGG